MNLKNVDEEREKEKKRDFFSLLEFRFKIRGVLKKFPHLKK